MVGQGAWSYIFLSGWDVYSVGQSGIDDMLQGDTLDSPL